LADVFEFDALETPIDLAIEPANAAERLQAIAERARRQGHAEGLEAGTREAADRTALALQAVAEADVQVRASEVEFLERAERAAVGLAMEIAAKVVSAELQTRPELVLEIVSGTLRAATERDGLVIEVSPEDFPLVRDSAEDLAGRLGGIRRLEVVAERRVDRGGCVVRTPEGEIDARISEQMQRLAEVLEDAHRRPEPDA
jgi:flagellar assembly protein FliH